VPSYANSLRIACFIPTFQDTALLTQNFADREIFPDGTHIFVYDDNCSAPESLQVEQLCKTQRWEYRRSK
jgi:hypothetical protein